MYKCSKRSDMNGSVK